MHILKRILDSDCKSCKWYKKTCTGRLSNFPVPCMAYNEKDGVKNGATKRPNM